MIELQVTRGDNQESVRIVLPATPVEIGEAFAWLDEVSRYAGDIRIVGVHCPIPNLGQYIRSANLDHCDELQRLNTLAERINKMGKKNRKSSPGLWTLRVSTDWTISCGSQSVWRTI